ncbi:hypothetical protein CA2015_0560 [Cyclobacterium amurskyense]|uniref:Uncharacterized protein n=1 Tax=Cyclobacterium amurskyense TaxID=320787 RepID=A0A0H4PP72_9BACT|nr:hypothetical protein CA2015_0560 [Cyclobacterium amurskyense]
MKKFKFHAKLHKVEKILLMSIDQEFEIKPGLWNRVRNSLSRVYGKCCNRKKIRLFGDFSIAPLW